MAGLWREDLVPFRELLPRLPLVIVSSAAYKAYDFDPPRPALLSANVVRGLLRTKLVYQGLAVADIAELKAAQKRLEPGDAVVRSLEAGCDLFVIEGTRNSLDKTMRTVKASLESGRLLTERLEKSLARINAAKKSLSAPERTITVRELKQFADQFEKWATELGSYREGHIGD